MRPWKSPLFPWNWRKVRTAQITKEDRDLFERYGENVIGTMLTGNVSPQAPDLKSIFTTHKVDERGSQVIGNKFDAARDWLTECRDADERHKQRAETIEVGVVILIGLEIVLSLYGIREGNKQARVLEHMDSSTGATAAAMAGVQTDLQILATEQAKSAGQLQQMNDSLQTSTGTARNQLHILREEQADTLASRSKKPKLLVSLEGESFDATEQRTTVTTFTTSENSATLNFSLYNAGNATAHTIIVKVLLEKGYTLTRADNPQSIERTLTWRAPECYLYRIPVTYLRPDDTKALPLTVSFPTGLPVTGYFFLVIMADTDEESSAVPLANLTVRIARQPN